MTNSAQQTYQLRDYQQALVQEVFTQWHRGNRQVMMHLRSRRRQDAGV